MTWQEYLPFASLIISLVAVYISIVSYRRTDRTERFEYAPRIQLSDEKIVLGGVDRELGFSYEATLNNLGSKPLRIDSVYLDYGSPDIPADRMKYQIEGEFYLLAGGTRAVSQSLDGQSIAEVNRKYQSSTCGFYLRVRVHTLSDGIIERTRNLVSTTESGGGVYFVPRGDILL